MEKLIAVFVIALELFQVANAQCHPNEVFVINQCVCVTNCGVTCNLGQFWNQLTNLCETPFQCSTGSYWSPQYSLCLPISSPCIYPKIYNGVSCMCPTGTVETGNSCICLQSDYVWNPALQVCVPAGFNGCTPPLMWNGMDCYCPGTLTAAGNCITVVCPQPGYIYNNQLNICVPFGDTNICFGNKIWNGSACVC